MGLKKVTEESEEIESTREELESKEQEADERVEELESNLKEMRRTVEINELRAVDGERKHQVCKNDIAKIQERAEKHEARVAQLEELIEGHGKRLEELEETEGAAGEREALNEEKLEFLTVQLKETEIRADTAERMNAVLANTLLETETEIAGWMKKTQDMEDLMLVMDDIADDPAYDLSKGAGGQRASFTPSSAKDMWGAKDAEAESQSRSSSRASSRAGLTRAPKSPEPEPEPESEEEEEEEAPAPPPPAPAPAPEPESEEEEESEEEDSEEEESDEE